MTMPPRHDLTLYKGQSFSQPIVFKYKKTKEPVPLTGITAKAEIRPSFNSEILIAEFDIAMTPAEGRVVLSLDPETSASIADGFYEWDLKMTDENDDVAYYVRGQFIVTGRVTV